jgi:hypothetical protein
MNLINQKIIKFLPKQLSGGFAKTAIVIGLFAYWGLIIIGTFVQFN